MIRTLVVDDDYRVASIHAAYVAKVPGFDPVGEVHSAAEAVTAIDGMHPDLLLLDLYLPDEHGLELVTRLRAGRHHPVDVIVITAAKDADSVRAALQHGVLYYLLKPFSFPALRDKLQSYVQMRGRLDSLGSADQRSVDKVFGSLRVPTQLSLAKGMSEYTLETVQQLLLSAPGDLSASEVAELAGVSRATAQRYLTHLHEVGRATIRLRYGPSGRPEHGYCWSGSPNS
jgi:two-component system CitB family response regulator